MKEPWGLRHILVGLICCFAWPAAVGAGQNCGIWHGERPAGAPCRDVSIDGAAAVSCAWEFGYRDGQARAKQARMQAELRRCLPGARRLEDAPGVNHPDTHLVAQYRHGTAKIAIAVKDKAARRQSLVFLTFQGME